MNYFQEDKLKDAEFRGLFLGEGYCSIYRTSNKCKYKDKTYNYPVVYRAKLSLAQRADNKDMLLWIKERYGGNLWVQRDKRITHNLSYHWATDNIGKISQMCKVLLEGVIPSKKLNSIRKVKEYCDWKLERGLQRKMTEEDYQKVKEMYEFCKNNHAYSGTVT